MAKFLDFIETANAVGLKQAFDERVIEKVAAELNLMKADVADRYFNKSEQVDETVKVGYPFHKKYPNVIGHKSDLSKNAAKNRKEEKEKK